MSKKERLGALLAWGAPSGRCSCDAGPDRGVGLDILASGRLVAPGWWRTCRCRHRVEERSLAQGRQDGQRAEHRRWRSSAGAARRLFYQSQCTPVPKEPGGQETEREMLTSGSRWGATL
jgi:hypothetical protein